MSTTPRQSDPLLEEAVDRLMRRRDGDETGLAEWLALSDAHRRAWAAVEQSWDLLDDFRPEPVPAEVVSLPVRRRNWTGWAAGFAVAACLGAGLILAPGLLADFGASYSTTTAETETVTLTDGTMVTLAASSAIADDLSGSERRVRLLSGQAFFDVAHDTERPFVVEAGGVDVTVLGTAFDVRLAPSETVVELARGAVAVTREGTPGQTLAPGQSVTVDRANGAMTLGSIAPEDIGLWRQGELFVEDATIADVVALLQPYHASWIVAADVELMQQKVTGLYDLRDPDRALRALVQPHGGHVYEISPLVRVLTRL